jgi:hypothetical protein
MSSCEGTGFPTVEQPKQASRKIYPSPCGDVLEKDELHRPGPRRDDDRCWRLDQPSFRQRPFSRRAFAKIFFRRMCSGAKGVPILQARFRQLMTLRFKAADARAGVPPLRSAAIIRCP